MAHLHTAPGQHDFTASAYIIRVDHEEPKILLHRHKRLQVLMQFGGHVELTETPWEAVEREVLEESGYEFNQLTLLQPPSRITHLSNVDLHPVPMAMVTYEFMPGHFHTDIAWLFIAHESPTQSINTGESDSLQLFSRKKLVELPTDTIPKM